MRRAFAIVAGGVAIAIAACAGQSPAPPPPASSARAAPIASASSSASPQLAAFVAALASSTPSALASASAAASASSGPPMACNPLATVLGANVAHLRVGMTFAEVEETIGRGEHAAVPLVTYADRDGASYTIAFVDPDGSSSIPTRGLQAVVYYPPGAPDGCYLLPAARRGKRAAR